VIINDRENRNIMNYWVFTVTQKKLGNEVLTTDNILAIRLADHFWGLGERTPNRRYLLEGDRIVFYKGNPSMTFAVSAILASDVFKLTDGQKLQFGHDKSFYRADYGACLTPFSYGKHLDQQKT
jgi:hypothetical protein